MIRHKGLRLGLVMILGLASAFRALANPRVEDDSCLAEEVALPGDVAGEPPQTIQTEPKDGDEKKAEEKEPLGPADPKKVPSDPKLFLQDVVHAATGPLHWKKRDWLFLGGTIVGLGVLSLADDKVTRELTRGGRNTFFDDVLDVYEPIGAAPGAGGFAAVYLYGAIFHDQRARELAFDALTADAIATAITQILKGVVGRGRPESNQGAFSFEPLQAASFPSGHTTQAFAFATVISATYNKTWVTVVSMTGATLVGLARIRHSAHFATDVAAGALIGTSTALSVVRFNRKQRTQPKNTPERVILGMAPSIDGRGLALVLSLRLGHG